MRSSSPSTLPAAAHLGPACWLLSLWRRFRQAGAAWEPGASEESQLQLRTVNFDSLAAAYRLGRDGDTSYQNIAASGR